MKVRRDANVLDASAVLAYLQREPGYETVQKALAEGSYISTVNLAEVLGKVVSRGIDAELVLVRLDALGLQTISFSDEDARLSAQLVPKTRVAGLSLGDRACLALASRLNRVALTADTVWKSLDVGVNVALIR